VAQELKQVARNTAEGERWSPHDDGVARDLGYERALIPGLTLLAYLARPAFGHLGPEWLSQGRIQVSNLKPVYGGEELTIAGAIKKDGEDPPALELTARNASGALCAIGQAQIATTVVSPDADAFLDEQANVSARLDLVDEPEVGARVLSMRLDATADDLLRYLAATDETHAYYATHQVFPPGYAMLIATWTRQSGYLKQAPMIYASGSAHFFRPLRAGDSLIAPGVVTARYTRKGQDYVDVEQLVMTVSRTPVALVRSSTIYRPRRGKVARERIAS
jgi:hypothetical protein